MEACFIVGKLPELRLHVSASSSTLFSILLIIALGVGGRMLFKG
jgi:hypothetical protein